MARLLWLSDEAWAEPARLQRCEASLEGGGGGNRSASAAREARQAARGRPAGAVGRSSPRFRPCVAWLERLRRDHACAQDWLPLA